MKFNHSAGKLRECDYEELDLVYKNILVRHSDVKQEIKDIG